jgi:hypothetical protein
VVGGRQFTSGILQRNCHEFIAYENLLQAATGGDGSRAARVARSSARSSSGIKPLASALPNIQRALKILAEREVAPQLGLLKSTMLQLDPTFTERDYGAGSFLEYIQKLEKAGFVLLRKTDRGYLVEIVEGEGVKEPEIAEPASETSPAPEAPTELLPPPPPPPPAEAAPESALNAEETLGLLKKALSSLTEKAPSRPIYLRQVRQALRNADGRFDERQSGFHGLLDILHQAQREGWVRLHRDRKGIWRIFPASTAAIPAPVAAEPVPEPAVVAEIETAPPETDVLWEAVESPEATTVIEVAEAAPPPSEEPAPVEVAQEKKVRKIRPAKPSSRRGQRKATSRRKPKETTE